MPSQIFTLKIKEIIIGKKSNEFKIKNFTLKLLMEEKNKILFENINMQLKIKRKLKNNG